MTATDRSNAVLVVNTASRSGRNCFEYVAERLRTSGVELKEKHAVRNPALLAQIVRGSIERGAGLVIVGGGDGTVTSIAPFFANASAVLGLLPTGTGNSFARSLEMPLDLDGAIDTIVNGTIAQVDLATVNGRYFANAASVGLSTQVGRNTPGSLKRIVGPFAYVVQGIRETLASRAFEFRLVADDGTVRSGSTQQIVVLNGRMFGTTPILPDATLLDGELAVFALQSAKRMDIAKMWLGLLLGGFHTKLDAATFFNTRKLELTTKPERTIDIDGELRVRTPAVFEVVPRALRLCVPSPSATARR